MNCRISFNGNQGRGVDLGDDLHRLRAFPFDSARVDMSVVFNGMRHRCLSNDCKLSLQRKNIPRRLTDGYSGQWQQINWFSTRHSGDYEITHLSYMIAHGEPLGRADAVANGWWQNVS
jgi:hypothetical protein